MRRVTVAACAGAALAMAAGLHGLVGPSSARTAAEPPAGGAEINPDVATCNTTLPPVSPPEVTPDMVLRGPPCSVAFDGDHVKADLTNLQLAFDFNSWLTFTALNAPASGGRTQWQGWQDLSDLMLESGAPPPPFGTSLPPPPICTGGAAGAPVIRQISKTPTTPTISVAGQPLNTGPLIDQDGNYARYQILVNKPMYDYVVSNGLYSRAGQTRFAGPIQFPAGETRQGTTGRIGAIVVKVAWKVLSGRDDPAAFLTTRGYVYTPASPGVREACRVDTLGLVGMHIVHKEQDEPQWNWATFEHRGNVPDAPATGGRFSFYDPSCGDACPINRQPPQPWDPSTPPHPGMFRSQIVRTTQYPIQATDSATHWNVQFQKVLEDKSLAAYKTLTSYKLITTQWPTDAKSKTDPNGSPFPLFSANTTMETYVQGNVPKASSSCMACHGNATDTSGKVSDFTFILEKAH